MRCKLSIIIQIKGRNDDEPFIVEYRIQTWGYSEWYAFKNITGINEYCNYKDYLYK